MQPIMKHNQEHGFRPKKPTCTNKTPKPMFCLWGYSFFKGLLLLNVALLCSLESWVGKLMKSTLIPLWGKTNRVFRPGIGISEGVEIKLDPKPSQNNWTEFYPAFPCKGIYYGLIKFGFVLLLHLGIFPIDLVTLFWSSWNFCYGLCFSQILRMSWDGLS